MSLVEIDPLQQLGENPIVDAMVELWDEADYSSRLVPIRFSVVQMGWRGVVLYLGTQRQVVDQLMERPLRQEVPLSLNGEHIHAWGVRMHRYNEVHGYSNILAQNPYTPEAAKGAAYLAIRQAESGMLETIPVAPPDWYGPLMM